MKIRVNKQRFIAGISLLIVFIVFTLSLLIVDVKPIGPNGSAVAYSAINGAVHSAIGVNMLLYTITDWLGIVVVLVPVTFALLGLYQWISRKSITKVDRSIIMLGIFYICVFSTYMLFEYIVINFRPVLINGNLETSYPSSTTMLSMCVLPTAMMQVRERITHHIWGKALYICLLIFTIFMVVGRFCSGVHWTTDIIGGAVYSTAMLLIYNSLV